jgi:hypothetical protein
MSELKHLYQQPNETRLQLVKRAVDLANHNQADVVIAKSRDHAPTIIQPGDDPVLVAKMLRRAELASKATIAGLIAFVIWLIWITLKSL